MAMTRDGAREIIRKILAGTVPCSQSLHFLQELEAHGYSMYDVRSIMQSCRFEHPPYWSGKHANFKAYLRGKCLAFGRPTCVLLGLLPDGPNVYATVFPIADPTREVPRRP
ncbi:MAG: hypothetical protein HZB25_02720 [Candidatus Eisenbacteria bacterium]|nr:hypothetical protein [Candidatus Eisenbacteria bacterium]